MVLDLPLRGCCTCHRYSNDPPQGKEWYRLDTLARVIGADHAETTRLLIEVGARGSQSEKNVWALRSRKPLHSPESE